MASSRSRWRPASPVAKTTTHGLTKAADVAVGIMSDPAKRPRSRDGRTKSATARLKTPPESHFSKPTKSMRGNSALLNRDKQVSSKKVFPRPSSADRERFRTQYARDYEGSFVFPTSARPTSPTRRNNPHPTKVRIMQWWQKLCAIGFNYAAIYGLESAIERDRCRGSCRFSWFGWWVCSFWDLTVKLFVIIFRWVWSWGFIWKNEITSCKTY